MKKIWIVLAATLFVTLPFRFYGIFSLLDLDTGFYSDGGTISVVTSAVLIAGAVAMAVMSRKTCGTGVVYRPVRDVLTAVTCALTGVLVMVQSLAGFVSPGFGNRTVGLIFSAAGIPAGLVFLAAAYDFAAGVRNLRKFPLAALIPSVWGCLCLWTLFAAYSTTVNLIENVYNTFTVILLLLFLFHQAKLLTGIESEKSGKLIFVLGFPAAMFSFATGVPNVVLFLSGKSLQGSFPAGLHSVNTMMAVYILCFLSAEYKQGLFMPENQEAVQEAPENPEPPAVSPAARQAQPVVHRPLSQDACERADLQQTCSNFLKKEYGGAEVFMNPSKSTFYNSQTPENQAIVK